MTPRLASAVACALLTAGCDTRSKDPAPDVLKAQRQQMERAKEAGKLMEQSSEQRREQDEGKQK